MTSILNMLFDAFLSFLPFIILIGVIYFVYVFFFKKRWNKFARELSLSYSPQSNVAYPEALRDLNLFNDGFIRLNKYLDGVRNNTSWGVYTFSKNIGRRRIKGFLLFSASNSAWSFPYSAVERHSGLVGFVVGKAFSGRDSDFKVEGVPSNYSFVCENKDSNSEFVSKVKSFLNNTSDFKFKRIILKNNSVAFLFDIEQTRKTPKLVLKCENFLNSLSKN